MSFMSGRDEVVVLCMGWAMREESPADALPEAMCTRNLGGQAPTGWLFLKSSQIPLSGSSPMWSKERFRDEGTDIR